MTDLSSASVRRQSNWIGFRTIVTREFSRIIRIWGQTLLPSAPKSTAMRLTTSKKIGETRIIALRASELDQSEKVCRLLPMATKKPIK